MSKFDVSGFLAEFFHETSQRLQSINQKLVLLEADELDAKGLNQLRRDVHTIKGSAQMLGVQDISDVSHLFEDTIQYAVKHAHSRARPMLQFLFDLHDSLQNRLQIQDAQVHLDSASLQVKFEQLQQQLQAHAEDTLEKDNTHAQKAVKKTKKTRRKRKVPKHLISAIMGSLEGSLDNHELVKEEDHVPDYTTEKQATPSSDVAEIIDFRPDVAVLNMQDVAIEKGSGNFLRVDRTRIARLSNQIIELASDRYRDSSPERQLQAVMQDFQQLEDKFAANTLSNPRAQTSMQAELKRQSRQLQQLNDALRYHQRRSSAMLDDLRDQVFGLMLRPLNSIFSVFPRTVRDAAVRSGKKVQLLIAGDTVEMDQLAAEALIEPFIHLINNAIAHGIEQPEQRVKDGKPEEGQITICAKHKGSNIEIVISDDGQGMNVDVIRSTAIANGLINSDEADDMDASEVLDLIFHPGFTTQQEVNDSAGRGMGMSIVFDAIRELTGSIHIRSEQGQGSQFVLTVPVTVTVQQAMLLRVSNQRFAILANLVHQVIPLSDLDIKTGHGPHSKGYIDYQGHRVLVIDLRDGLNDRQDTGISENASALLVEHLDGFLAIVVDVVLHEEVEVMVRELDPYLKYYQPIGLMGCTIIEDGTVQLLIEPNGLKEMWRTAPDAKLAITCISTDIQFTQRMLLVDDSSIALQIEKTIFEKMGFTVDVAMGTADALEKITLHQYDLLITDLEMPDMDGIGLIKHLRNQQRFKDLPILILATREGAEEQQHALAAGANAYLLKRHLEGGEATFIETLSTCLA